MLTLRLSLPNPALWERFLGGDPRGLPAPLLRCWERARAFQLSPLAARARAIPPRRLVERREQSAALMRVAGERFAPLSAQTEGRQLLLLVVAAAPPGQSSDWLIDPPTTKTRLAKTADGVTLTNGLIELSLIHI